MGHNYDKLYLEFKCIYEMFLCFSPKDNDHTVRWRAVLYLEDEPVQPGAKLLPRLSVLQVRTSRILVAHVKIRYSTR